jgi:hypothetical protein
MNELNNHQSARQVIAGIANTYIELSHDKAYWQRDDIVKRCQAWLKANPVEVDCDQNRTK